jgi:hypothetical protein
VSAEEKNKALARKFFEEAWGKGNLAAVDEFIAAEYVMYPSLLACSLVPRGPSRRSSPTARHSPTLRSPSKTSSLQVIG